MYTQNTYQQPPPQGYNAPQQGYSAPPPKGYSSQPPPVYKAPSASGYDAEYGAGGFPQDDRAPLTSGSAASTNQSMFPSLSSYRDVMFAIAFIFHLLAFAVYVTVASIKDPVPENEADLKDVIPTVNDDLKKVLLICAGCAVMAGLLSVIALAVLRKFAKQAIYASIVSACLMWLSLGVVSVVNGFLIGGIITLFFAGLMCLFFYLWRNRIPFATAMLETIASLTEAYPGMIYTAYLSLVLQIGWVCVWAYGVTLLAHVGGGGLNFFAVFFLLLSLYWTSQVIKNVVHVTCSGVFATWYFLAGSTGVPAQPTIRSFKRATTTSFGSICLGSLLVAILRTLRNLVESQRGRDNIVGFLALCVLDILERLLRYFNLYAFTQVAIYGKSYCEAAKDTWGLIKSDGIQAIINDNIIGSVLMMTTLSGGIACAVLGGAVGYAVVEQYWGTCAVVGFMLGFCILSITMEVIESGVATIFVCFAMDSLALKRTEPTLYARFQATYGGY